MPLISFAMIVIGAYLVNSGIKARPPLKTLEKIALDPSNARTIFAESAGTMMDASEPTSGFSGGGGTFPKKDTAPATSSTAKNGRLTNAELVRISFDPSERLAPAAAAALESLNKAYRKQFGVNIAITDSYRDIGSQQALAITKPGLAAKPGTSNHGLGIALDLGGGINTRGSKQHEWMLANAPQYGWIHPEWTWNKSSSYFKDEPWHWEYSA